MNTKNDKNIADLKRYDILQKKQQVDWENTCKNCGACCGVVEGDACENLLCLENGSYTCKVYENRFGFHKTLSGRSFKCVPIRTILHKSWPGDENCAYKG